MGIVRIVPKVPNIDDNPSPFLIALCAATNQSPIAAVRDRKPPAPAWIPPKSCMNPLKSPLTISQPMPNIAKTPANVRRSLPAVSEPTIRPCVKFLNAFVMLASCAAVDAGKISRNACPRGLTIANKASNMLARPAIRSSRPPSSFHPRRRLFRESLALLTISSKTLLTFVQRALASLKSPTMISNVSAHPDPTDSCIVPMSWVKLLTSCAAAKAFSPILVVSSA